MRVGQGRSIQMKFNPKFIQRDCVEGDKADLRQAEAVLKHRTDIIIFEMPQGGSRGPGTIFNRYSCANKPIEKVDEIIKGLKVSAKKYPYALSDVAVWENVKTLWKEGVNVQIYNVDAPDRMRREFSLFVKQGYPAVRKEWFFWAYLYLRDTYMAKNIKKALGGYSKKQNPTVLIFLQSIHWEHTQFLLTNTSKEKVWKFYFGKLPSIKQDTIEEQIRIRSKVMGDYWKREQVFY